MGQQKTIWTEERVERLKELWMSGLSATRVAKELGGVSRNAVIGKVHRLGLKRDAASHSQAARASRPARPAPAPGRPPAAARRGRQALALKPQAETQTRAAPETKAVAHLAAEEKGRITDIRDLTRDTCRWPVGHPGEEGFAFCGDQVRDGASYCPHHCSIAYQSERRAASG